MNKVHKTIFNTATQTFIAVSELAKGKGKTKNNTSKAKQGGFVKTVLTIAMATAMLLAGANSAYAADNLTVGTGNIVGPKGLAVGENNIILTGTDPDYGVKSDRPGYGSLAVGGANTVGDWAVALGYGNKALGQVSQAIGTWSESPGHGAMSMGHKSLGYGDGSVAMGGIHHVKQDGTVSKDYIEKGGQALSIGALAIGTGTVAGTKGNFGLDPHNDTVGGSERAAAFGYHVEAKGDRSVAVGFGKDNSTHAEINANDAGTFGSENNVDGDRSYAIGNKNTIGDKVEDTFVLGSDVTATQKDSVILGKASTDRAFKQVTKAEIGGHKYEGFADDATKTGGVVSLGSKGKERQLINVASGRITADSTDGINGSQLFMITNGLQGQIDSAKDKGELAFTFTGNTNADTDSIVYIVETTLAKKADDTEIIQVGSKWYETKEVDGKKVADYTKPVEGDDLKTLKDKTTTVEKLETAAKDGTQRKQGEKLAIIGSKKAITLTEDTTSVATAGEYTAKNIQTVVTDGQIQIQMAKKPEFDTVIIGTPVTTTDEGGTKTTTIPNPITIGPVVEDPAKPTETKNRITGLDGTLEPTTNKVPANEGTNTPEVPATTAQAAPTNVDAIKGNAATVGDILNAGWNLQNNGTEKDFVKAYDTVNFKNGAGTTAKVEVRENGKISDVIYDVNVDNTTTEIVDLVGGKKVVEVDGEKYTADQLDKDGKVKEGQTALTADQLKNKTTAVAAKTTKLVLDEKLDPNNEGKTIPTGKVTVPDANKDNLVTAGDIAEAINDAYWSTKSVDGVDGGKVETKARHNVKASHKVDFAPGKNMKLTQEFDTTTNTTKYIYATKDKVSFEQAQVGGKPKLDTNGKPTFDANGNPVYDGKAPITIGTVDEKGTPKNRITGLDGTLPETVNGKTPTKKQAAPTNVDAIKGNAATVGDILNAGWNLQNNGDAKDFVKAYDTVNFVNGAATTVTVTPDEKGEKSDIKVDVKFDGKTITTNNNGELVANIPVTKQTTGSVNYDGTVKVEDTTNSAFLNASETVSLINNAFHTVKATNSTEQVKATDGEIKVKAGDTLTIDAGKNINAAMVNGKLALSTAADVEFDNIKVNKGLDMSDNQIKNVAAGTKPTDAVNVSQLKSIGDKLKADIDDVAAGVAGANAMAILGQARNSGDKAVSAGVGVYEDKAAIAVGISSWSDNGRWLLKGAVTHNTESKTGGGASVTYNW